MLKSIMPSDSWSSFVTCSRSTILALFDSIVWFVSGVSLSRVPAGLESANICDSTVLAVCVFAGEVCMGKLECVPGTLVLWHEVCETARSGVWVSFCVSSWSFDFGVCSHCWDGNCVP